jgi:hypothetical protein
MEGKSLGEKRCDQSPAVAQWGLNLLLVKQIDFSGPALQPGQRTMDFDFGAQPSPQGQQRSRCSRRWRTWFACVELDALLAIAGNHGSRGCRNPEGVWAWAPNTVRIRILLEQTTVQHIQDALFVVLGISLGVQTRPPLRTLSASARRYIRLRSPRIFRLPAFEESNDALSCFLHSVFKLLFHRLLAEP